MIEYELRTILLLATGLLRTDEWHSAFKFKGSDHSRSPRLGFQEKNAKPY